VHIVQLQFPFDMQGVGIPRN